MRTLLLSIIVLVIFTGCAGINYNVLDSHMKADQCSLAANYVSTHEKDYGENQRLLFLLDAAMINMLCKNYEESNKYFHLAEDLAEDLWTKSFTRETASLLVNDYTIPYAGEDFEKSLINLFSAINYARNGHNDDALVEIRRLDSNLTAINDKYEKKNVYNEDAFARYLSGIMYEADNNPGDAFIDYYKAYQVFEDYKTNYGTPIPQSLLEDLFRTANATGRTEEVRELHKDFSNVNGPKQKEIKGLGKIIFIHLNGKSPVKEDFKLYIPTKEGPVTIAFPKYVVKSPYCRGSKVIAESGSHRAEADAALVEDINEIAVKNLEDRKVRVIAKALVRAAAKQVAMRKATEDESILKLINIANSFVETADTRTWRTLPGEIYLTRLFLPAGKYDLYIQQCDSDKRAVESVNMKAGETRFVLYESMY